MRAHEFLSEKASIGAVTAPKAGTSQTLGQKYSGTIRPDSSFSNVPSRLTTPTSANTPPVSKDVAFQNAVDKANADKAKRDTAASTPAAPKVDPNSPEGQAAMKQQLADKRQQAKDTSSLGNLQGRNNPASGNTADDMIDRYAMPGVPRASAFTQQPPAGGKQPPKPQQQVGKDQQAPDVGTASSTGGQTFKTPTGQTHLANPNNPNQPKSTQAQAPAPSSVSTVAPNAQPTTAPTLGAPTATQTPKAEPASPTQAGQSAPAAKGASSTPFSKTVMGANAPATPGNKPTGFLQGLGQGFKQGMGIGPDTSLAKGLAVKGLRSAGLSGTAGAVQNMTNTELKPGSTINDLRYGGNVKVLPNGPGKQGLVHLDTTKTLGQPIYVDPKDLSI